MIPRPYQSRCLDDVWSWFHDHPDGNCVVDACVGAGKSFLIAELCKRAMSQYPDTRILTVVHQKELLEQNLDKLTAVWPDAPVGIHSAGVGKSDIGYALTYATIGSVHRKAHLLGRVDLILADECFVAGTKISTPAGSVNIEDIKIGDVVFNQAGSGVVEAVSHKESDSIYSVELSNGTVINCTGNHPFFTEKGWSKASELENGARLFSCEDMRMLWARVSALGEDDGRSAGFCNAGAGMEEAEILLSEVCKEIKPYVTGQTSETKDQQSPEGDSAQTYSAWRERAIADLAAACAPPRAWGRMGGRTCDQNGVDHGRRSTVVQGGHSEPINDDSHRGGWWEPLPAGEKRAGREENKVPGGIRVVGVSRIKREGATPVFNIQVSGHPSYFANGVAVHNCHLINPREVGMWRSLIAELRRYNPMCRVIGLTGTPFRGDGVWLTAAENPLFHGIAARITMRELLELGYLAPLTTKPTRTTIDASGVQITGGDYNIKQLEDVANDDALVENACDELVTLAVDRKRWLVFCVTVDHAMHVCSALRRRGVTVDVVSAETPAAVRADLIQKFREGKLRALCNVAVLTTGFDVPAVDCIALLRNTRSPVLYVQIAGRGMRVLGADIHESKANGKADTLWLDFTDTTDRLGPVDQIKGRGPKRKKDGAAPVKVCDECGSVVHASARECPDCGAEFHIDETAPHGAKVSDAQIISTERKIKTYAVTNVTYAQHQKPGKPCSIQVSYWHGMRVVAKEWVCPIHGGFAGAKGRRWLEQRGIHAEYSVDRGTIDALPIDQWLSLHSHRISTPPTIILDESGKYAEILGYGPSATERTDSNAGAGIAQAA